MIGKTFFLYHLKQGKLKFISKPVYEILIGIELRWMRVYAKKTLLERTGLVDEKLTAVIKTFERPEILKRLVSSIKHFYPMMKIIVVDDSREPVKLDGVETIILPYDSGVSVGRQKALESVHTPYLLLLDDDFIFYSRTDLEQAMRYMEKYPRIDIMGGEVIDLPFFSTFDYSNAPLHPTLAQSTYINCSEVGKLPIYDKVANFFIGRTERIKLVGWDIRIKRLDHADFFTRAKGVLVTVFNKDLKVLHAKTPFKKDYMQKRFDLEGDVMILREKYYCKKN